MAGVLGRYSNPRRRDEALAKAKEAATAMYRETRWNAPQIAVTKRRRLSPEDTASLVQEYLNGASPTKLATKYSVTDTTVRARIRAAGVPIRQRQSTEALTEEMRKLRTAGWSNAKIARRHGMSGQAVGQRLNKKQPKDVC